MILLGHTVSAMGLESGASGSGSGSGSASSPNVGDTICSVREAKKASAFCGSVGWLCKQPAMACTAPNINPNWDCKAKARVLFQQWWLHTQKAKHACHFGGDAVLANVTAAPTRVPTAAMSKAPTTGLSQSVTLAPSYLRARQ